MKPRLDSPIVAQPPSPSSSPPFLRRNLLPAHALHCLFNKQNRNPRNHNRMNPPWRGGAAHPEARVERGAAQHCQSVAVAPTPNRVPSHCHSECIPHHLEEYARQQQGPHTRSRSGDSSSTNTNFKAASPIPLRPPTSMPSTALAITPLRSPSDDSFKRGWKSTIPLIET